MQKSDQNQINQRSPQYLSLIALTQGILYRAKSISFNILVVYLRITGQNIPSNSSFCSI